jgi:hypothetical protein
MQCSVKDAHPKATMATITGGQVAKAAAVSRVPAGACGAMYIAMTKHTPVIRTASAIVAKKKCIRPRRALKPNTKPSIGAPFWANCA